MEKTFKGIWVYFIFLLFLALLGTYFAYRSRHSTITLAQLTVPQSKFAWIHDNPCFSAIIGGIPYSPLPDGNIQINVICPDGSRSMNYVRLGAIAERPNIYDSLVLLTSINNFKIVFTDLGGKEVVSLGKIKNENGHNWKVLLNGNLVKQPLEKEILKINDVVELIYE